MTKNKKKEKSTMNENTMNQKLLSVEVFLTERYAFRQNVLNGKLEFFSERLGRCHAQTEWLCRT